MPQSRPIEDEDLTDMVSPFVLNMIIQVSEQYAKAYKSYAFGLRAQLASKWIWILMAVIMGIIIVLFFTGNLPGVH